MLENDESDNNLDNLDSIEKLPLEFATLGLETVNQLRAYVSNIQNEAKPVLATILKEIEQTSEIDPLHRTVVTDKIVSFTLEAMTQEQHQTELAGFFLRIEQAAKAIPHLQTTAQQDFKLKKDVDPKSVLAKISSALSGINEELS